MQAPVVHPVKKMQTVLGQIRATSIMDDVYPLILGVEWTMIACRVRPVSEVCVVQSVVRSIAIVKTNVLTKPVDPVLESIALQMPIASSDFAARCPWQLAWIVDV